VTVLVGQSHEEGAADAGLQVLLGQPGQLDTDSLPDYGLLDALLSGYIDGDQGHDDLIAAGHDVALVDRILRMVDLAEYKRRQSAPGPKITRKAFGRDRRLPITNRFREGA